VQEVTVQKGIEGTKAACAGGNKRLAPVRSDGWLKPTEQQKLVMFLQVIKCK